MGFVSEKQRKGFFANVRSKVHTFNKERHDRIQKELIEKSNKEQAKLNKLKSQVITIEKRNKLKQDIIMVKQQEKELRKIKFDNSHTGKFFNAAKRGVDSAVEFEKTHGKAQINELKKVGKSVGKAVGKFQ